MALLNSIIWTRAFLWLGKRMERVFKLYKVSTLQPSGFHSWFKMVETAWSCRCKKWGIPVEKIYNKTQREKFAWAIDMADEDYEF